ncbi:hypothetical protein [uncultured Roseobacter sp.]|uniref:hypothetical protein n=1 Tax=uncultured Roseobacter sp. TaxID=114847 RepID=UPI0026185956|nr:hypothetical protein [uncultured Roseobacter sp.]
MPTLTVSVFVQIAILLFVVRAAIIAMPKGTDRDAIDLFLFGRNSSVGIKKNSLTWTAVASYFQAATSLVLGFEFGYYYGLLVVLTAVSFGVGIYLLWYVFSSSRQLFGNYELERIRFPFDVALHRQSQSAKLVINILVYVVIPFSAVIEVWYASSIIEEIYLGVAEQVRSPILGFESWIGAVAFITISFVLAIYVTLSGYKSVVATDKIQVFLIFTAVASFFVGSVSALWDTQTFALNVFFLGALGSDASTASIWLVSFVIGGVTLNGLWQFVEPQQWHRAASAENVQVYKSSLPKAAFSTCALWVVPAMLGAVFAATGEDVSGYVRISAIPFVEVFQALGAGILAQIALAIAVSGIIAAALSSSDTVIMAFVARVAHLLGESSISIFNIRVLSLSVSVLIIIAAWIFYIQSPNVVSVIFAVFPAQLFFFGIFWKYVRYGGKITLNFRATYLIVPTYAICLLSSVLLNIFPGIFSNTWETAVSNAAVLMPVAIALLGWLVATLTVEQKNSLKTEPHTTPAID